MAFGRSFNFEVSVSKHTNYASQAASNLNSTDDMNLTEAVCALTHKCHGVNTASRQAPLERRAGGDTLGKNSKHWQHSTHPSSSSHSGSHCHHTDSCLQLLHLPDTFHFTLTLPNHSLCHTSIVIHSKPGSSNHSSHMY